jgi:electron transport complex protein RnfE
MSKNENKVSLGSIFKEGIFTGNPLFVQLLGLCPALAITTSIMNAVGMTMAFTFVLILSNITISLIRKIVPDEIRIPVYIIVVATFVTCVSLLMQALMPALYDSLATFVNLIVVNCIILGRAEAFASKNKVVPSIVDALGQSLGYGLALLIISAIREIIGTQSITLSNPFDSTQSVTLDLLTEFKISFFTSAAGAFVTMGIILAVIAAMKQAKENKAKKGDAK